MKFAKADGLGYLTFCPTNLGTTMRASVHVRVPMLSKDPKVLNDICAKYNLQPRGGYFLPDKQYTLYLFYTTIRVFLTLIIFHNAFTSFSSYDVVVLKTHIL